MTVSKENNQKHTHANTEDLDTSNQKRLSLFCFYKKIL